MTRRVYFAHRRAYWPRLWPVTVTTGLASGGLTVVTGEPWISIGVALILGSGTMTVRLWWWRRRHPMISTAELIADQRDAAPWN